MLQHLKRFETFSKLKVFQPTLYLCYLYFWLFLQVEILSPPNGAVPGDLIEVDGYVRRPDAVLNPKKKIWETVAPDLKTDAAKVATFKGSVLSIPNKGPIVAPTLANVQIK